MPRASGGILTFNSCGDDSRISSLRTSSTWGASSSNLGSSSFVGVLSAIPRSPSKTACFAAANVPECQTPVPRFGPRLIPDKTQSTLSQRCTPRATQSAGVPLTRYASKFFNRRNCKQLREDARADAHCRKRRLKPASRPDKKARYWRCRQPEFPEATCDLLLDDQRLAGNLLLFEVANMGLIGPNLEHTEPARISSLMRFRTAPCVARQSQRALQATPIEKTFSWRPLTYMHVNHVA
jgi:hypothetical protein